MDTKKKKTVSGNARGEEGATEAPDTDAPETVAAAAGETSPSETPPPGATPSDTAAPGAPPIDAQGSDMPELDVRKGDTGDEASADEAGVPAAPSDDPAGAAADDDDIARQEPDLTLAANIKADTAIPDDAPDRAGGDQEPEREDGGLTAPAASQTSHPDQEISRLDTLLARITGQAGATTVPSNDNLNAAGGGKSEEHNSSSGRETAAEAGAEEDGEEGGQALHREPDGTRQHGSEPDEMPGARAMLAETDKSEEQLASEESGEGWSAPENQPAEGASEPRNESGENPRNSPPADETGLPGQLSDGDELVPPPTGDDDEWPDGWGPPSGPNVLRVLSELMAQLEAQQTPGGAAAVTLTSSPDDTTAQTSQPVRPMAEPSSGQPLPAPQGAKPPDEQKTAFQPPPRPVLTGPPARRGSAYWRPVRAKVHDRHHDDPAGAQRSPPTPVDAPRADPPAAPQPAASADAPAQRHKRDLAPWILEQPEFQRAFGARPGEPPVETSERPTDAHQLIPGEVASDMYRSDSATRWRHARGLATMAAIVAVFAVAGYSGYLLYEMRHGGGAPSQVPGTTGEQGGGAAGTAAQSLLPRPVLPPGAGDTLLVHPRATGASDPVPSGFSTFSSTGNRSGAGPKITIERTAVRPFAAGSPGALAVSRLDGLNVTVAKLIAAFEVDKAEETVADILARDPTHFGALLNRGRINLLRDRFEAAEADFKRAREIKPQSLAAALGESEALLGQRRGAEALKLIEGSISANPGEAAAYELRARAHALTGQSELVAIDCAELSWKTGLSYAGKWCEAMAYKDAGRIEDSETAFRAALSEGGEDFVRHRQSYLSFRGHYTGEIDGQAGPATNRAISACAVDPYC